MKIDFIKDKPTLVILEAILEIVGPNYNFPHDSDVQPSDNTERNDEDLTQFDLPGGTTLKSMQPPSINPGMGSVISSLLTVLAPIMSAYGFLLPILGIIKAIIEILCCLMNPFCVVPAIVRLFKKYLPPFISLFPPAAGVVIIKSVVKLITAVVFYIMTEIVPIVQLIATAVLCVTVAIANEDNLDEPTIAAQVDACKEKALDLVIQLINKLGILGVLKPLLEIVFLILQLVAGIPCGSGDVSSAALPMFALGFSFATDELDTSCCNDFMCPPEISSPPQGQGLLVPSFFGDSPPGWSWTLIPFIGHPDIPKLIPYLQDFKSQLDPQLDEAIDEARSIGAIHDAAHFRLRILGRRGEKFCKTSALDPEPQGSILVPIAKISGFNVILNNRLLAPFAGVVDYCIEPNYEQLISHNIMAVSCHPDIVAAKAGVSAQFSEIMEQSAIARFPEISGLNTEFDDFSDTMNNFAGDIKKVVDKPAEEYSLDDIPALDAIQDAMLAETIAFASTLNGYLGIIVSRTSDKVSSALDVDKNIVKSGGVDKAIVFVTPRDVTGTAIMKNVPSSVQLSVELFTDFGTLQNQSLDGSTGVVTAELISAFPGTANVIAKVNNDFIITSYDETASVQVEQVRFIADAVLPKRRHASKLPGSRGASTEREPGSR